MSDWLHWFFNPQLFRSLRWQDVVDIILVSYIIYQLFHWLRDTRAVQLLRGLALLFLAYFTARALGLSTITWLMQSMATMILVAIPVVFQPELRRILAQLGQASLLFSPPEGPKGQDVFRLVNEVANATSYLANNRIGALIVLECKTGLGEFIKTGVPLAANVTSELIRTIFHPGSPLHDGAIIIRGQQIACASALLPLAEDVHGIFLGRQLLGTRHRAALGLSETTDGLCIVVSEETGDISAAKEGRLHRHLSEESLRDLLLRHFQSELVPTTASLQPLLMKFGVKGVNETQSGPGLPP